MVVLNTTAYTWDWYCYLVDDRASFVTLGITTLCHYAKCGFLFIVMLNVITLCRSAAKCMK
jgi:hypothetical protein